MWKPLGITAAILAAICVWILLFLSDWRLPQEYSWLLIGGMAVVFLNRTLEKIERGQADIISRLRQIERRLDGH